LRELPAVAAIASISAAAITAPVSAAPAATTASAASAAPAVTTVASASAAPAAALGLRPSFVHHQISSRKILTVQRVHRAIRFFVVGNFNEGESARLPGKAVTNQVDCRGIDACLREKIV